MNWFGWLVKPQLEVSMLDRFVMIGEMIAVLFVWAIWSAHQAGARRARIRKKHGKHCTCFTCMGVT